MGADATYAKSRIVRTAQRAIECAQFNVDPQEGPSYPRAERRRAMSHDFKAHHQLRKSAAYDSRRCRGELHRTFILYLGGCIRPRMSAFVKGCRMAVHAGLPPHEEVNGVFSQSDAVLVNVFFGF